MTVTWYAEFAEAIARGEPAYRRCEECDAVGLPPRRTCPSCGEASMVEAALSDTAQVVSFTDIASTIPKFSGETPYTVVIAEFDEGVRLTGQLRGVDPDTEGVTRGDEVELGVERRGDEETDESGGDEETDENGDDEPAGDWLVTFTPV